jgi:CheY-like chemotaxis protein
VLELARPLGAQHGCDLKMSMADHPPTVAVHPVALRQALLSLLSVAIRRARGRCVHLSVRPLRWEAEIEVHAPSVSDAFTSASDDNADSLAIARQLADLCRGRLILSAEEVTFEARLIVPTLEGLPVLVIDDNADTLQLLQRYASGTRYHLICTRDPRQALKLAEESSPQIIVLDVMMPDVDGWEVLARLRQHPLVERTPIIVCTILAQKELALALGANAFLHKPVSRQDFLAALDHQMSPMEPEPR